MIPVRNRGRVLKKMSLLKQNLITAVKYNAEIFSPRPISNRMTKYLFSITLVVFSSLLFLPMAAAQNCRSEVKGYCAQTAAIAQAQGIGLENVIGGGEAADIIPALYKFGLGLVGISALIALIVGGVKYMTAGGSQDQTKRARVWLGNGVFGLVLALLSYLILNTINPDLLKRLDLELEPINLVIVPLGQDESGRNIGDPGSSAIIGRRGQPPDPTLLQQCRNLEASGCVFIPQTSTTGEAVCDCSGGFGGQGGP